jgi:hypothetical protein
MKAARRIVRIEGIQQDEAGIHTLVVTQKGVYLRKKGKRASWRFVPYDELWFSMRPVAQGPDAEKDE